jgi:predicted secreted Zn-dependent protease
MYDYINILCKTQAEEIPNHVNQTVPGILQEEAMHRKCKKLKLHGGQAYDRSTSNCSFRVVA